MHQSMSVRQTWIAEHDPLRIVRFDDEIVDRLGYPALSPYTETYWLPLLGPSALWALRRIAGWLEAEADGFEIELAVLGHQLGLRRAAGRQSPVVRSLARLGVFALARPGHDALAVRRIVPPLSHLQARRLPAHLQQLHDRELATRPRPSSSVNVTKPAVNAPPPHPLTAGDERVGMAFGEVAASPAPPARHDDASLTGRSAR